MSNDDISEEGLKVTIAVGHHKVHSALWRPVGIPAWEEQSEQGWSPPSLGDLVIKAMY